MVVVPGRAASAAGVLRPLIRGAGVGSRPGTLPLVLWARPTPAGERVWLWLRPGLELVDLDGKAGLIAVACMGEEVRIVRASQRYAALMRVDVARRDPLTGLVAVAARRC